MSDDRLARAEEIFLAAAAVPKDERLALFADKCADDAALRAEVDSLLAHHDAAADGFLETPPPWVSPDGSDRRIGAYRVLDVLGEGGMGVVYRAEQDRPRRIVALKIIRPGILSASSLRRFEHEAHVLGRLRHPGIAQIFEAGTADEGHGPQPYFAMELVAGSPLLQFARENRLGTRDRLALFAKVCDAVQHAHRHGVIHRDLKPANILVGDEREPKIIDFGVARATDSDLQVTTQRTHVGQLIGTIPYMSPEQCAADPAAIDTRTDVYALGVVLYELLAERLPVDVSRLSILDAARAIREREATPLSSVNRVFRGDVSTIVGRALEKDRERRYPSAGELGDDIRRFLREEPILARPASALYQMRKFARRNRALVGGLLATVVALVAGMIGTTTQWLAAVRDRNRAIEAEDLAKVRLIDVESERRRAESEASKTKEIFAFLLDAISSPDPSKAGLDTKMRDVLARASERASAAFSERPELEAALRATIGRTYHGLGALDLAEPHLRAALEIRESAGGGQDKETQESLNDLGLLLADRGRSAEAEPLLRRSLAIAESRGAQSREALSILSNLAYAMKSSGKLEEAEKTAARALDGLRRVAGDDAPETQKARSVLGSTLQEEGRLVEAAPILRDALEAQTRLAGVDDPDTIAATNDMAVVLKCLGRYDEAEPLLRRVAESARRVFGDRHPHSFIATANLASLLEETGRLLEAEPLFRAAREGLASALGAENPSTLIVAGKLGEVLLLLDRLDEAETVLRETIDGERRRAGADAPGALVASCGLARVLQERGHPEEAEPILRDVLERRRRTAGQSPLESMPAAMALASVLAERGSFAESDALHREAIESLRGAAGEEAPQTLRAVAGQAESLLLRGDAAQAEPLFRKAAFGAGRAFPAVHWEAASFQIGLGRCLFALERYAEAEEPLRLGFEGLRASLGPEHRKTLAAAANLAELYTASGKPSLAAAYREMAPAGARIEK